MKKTLNVKLYIWRIRYPASEKEKVERNFRKELEKLMKKYRVEVINASLEYDYEQRKNKKK